jgi:DNA-binding GntR family transcriptional regulator
MDDPPALGAVKQPTLMERAYDELLNGIVTGVFSRNQKLTVREIAEQLGLSPTPVKQAMNRLVGEGFLTLLPRRGLFVTPVSVERVADLYDARAMCELYAIRHLPPEPDPQFISDLKCFSRQCDESYKSGDSPKEFLQADQRFHLTIVELAGNSVISKWFKTLSVHYWEMYFRLYYRGKYGSRHRSTEEHDSVIRAIEAADVDLATQCIVEHIEHSKQHLIELIGSNGM